MRPERHTQILQGADTTGRFLTLPAQPLIPDGWAPFESSHPSIRWGECEG